jgi:Tol biopolymer transport system component
MAFQSYRNSPESCRIVAEGGNPVKRSNTAVAGLLLAAVLLFSGCLPGGGPQQQQAKVDPVYSPDGSSIVFVATHDGDPELYIADADGTNVRRLTDNEAVDASPRFAPDGSRLLFVSDRDGDFSIYSMRPDGSDVRMLELPLPQQQETTPAE